MRNKKGSNTEQPIGNDIVEIGITEEIPKKSEELYNDELANNIFDDLKIGLNLSDAAISNGIPVAIANEWFATNFNGFADRAQAAIIEFKKNALSGLWTPLTKEVVNASKFLLERKFRNEWGATSNNWVSIQALQEFMLKVGGILQRELADVDPDLLDRIANAIAEVEVNTSTAEALLASGEGPIQKIKYDKQ